MKLFIIGGLILGSFIVNQIDHKFYTEIGSSIGFYVLQVSDLVPSG